MQLTTRPLTPHFGAEVIGLDLDQVDDEGVRRRLEHLWWQHQVLLFRGLDVENERRLVSLSKVFGRLEIHSRTEYLSPEVPELLYVSNIIQGNRKIGVLGDGEADWHTDQVYRPTPALGSLLAAAIVPPSGGNTSFADMYRAYETLPEKTKARIDGLKAICSYEHFNNQYSEPANDGQRKAGTDQVHPVVRTHPITGRKALYLAKAVTPFILDIPRAESDALIAELDAWCRKPEFVYEHKWQVGDGILWDNACIKHRRDPFDPSHQRLMKRTTIRPPESLGVPF